MYNCSLNNVYLDGFLALFISCNVKTSRLRLLLVNLNFKRNAIYYYCKHYMHFKKCIAITACRAVRIKQL